VLINRSRLIIVDVPSVNPLVLSPSDVRLLEGPTLHRSLVTFADVTRKLASPTLTALAPFRSSKLTYLLSELLGGNAIVIALGLICPNEPAVTKKTMEIMENLTCARLVVLL
jgi:hypothetical protein